MFSAFWAPCLVLHTSDSPLLPVKLHFCVINIQFKAKSQWAYLGYHVDKQIFTLKFIFCQNFRSKWLFQLIDITFTFTASIFLFLTKRTKKNKKKFFLIFFWYFVGSLTWKIDKIEKTMFTKTPVTFVPKKSWKIWRHIWKAGT